MRAILVRALPEGVREAAGVMDTDQMMSEIQRAALEFERFAEEFHAFAAATLEPAPPGRSAL